MRTFSITLPNDLADSSQEMAETIGLTRAQFIRIAIQHELQRVQRKKTLEEMADSFSTLQKNKKYLKEGAALEQEFSSSLPEERDEWWTQL